MREVKIKRIVFYIILIVFCANTFLNYINTNKIMQNDFNIDNYELDLSNSNYLYKIINNNIPNFDLSKYNGIPFENYSDLDDLGRCGAAEALLGEETMPDKNAKRGSIGMIKPSGWPTPQKKYDSVEGKFLYNRCHLIGWQLSAENSNKKNLITGTSWLNKRAMLPYEQQVANYIRATHNHVLYRVTPIFEKDNLLASRIQIEAMSYEDNGIGIKMNIMLENYQPNIIINYANGDSYEIVSTDSIIKTN